MKIPTVSIPKMPRIIEIQIIGPVQHLTNNKKIIERKIEANTATTSTGHPYLKSYIHYSDEFKSNRLPRLTPDTAVGTQ